MMLVPISLKKKPNSKSVIPNNFVLGWSIHSDAAVTVFDIEKHCRSVMVGVGSSKVWPNAK